MSYGYSARLIETNKKANQKLLGVKLGKVCIRGNTSVADISEELGVSRQTIYNWFCGVSDPHPTIVDKVHSFIESVKPIK